MYQILMKGFGPWPFLLHRITAVKSQYIYSSIVFFLQNLAILWLLSQLISTNIKKHHVLMYQFFFFFYYKEKKRYEMLQHFERIYSLMCGVYIQVRYRVSCYGCAKQFYEWKKR